MPEETENDVHEASILDLTRDMIQKELEQLIKMQLFLDECEEARKNAE